MKEYNSFFSGSMKSDETDPYIYPANVHVDKNSKIIFIKIKTLIQALELSLIFILA